MDQSGRSRVEFSLTGSLTLCSPVFSLLPKKSVWLLGPVPVTAACVGSLPAGREVDPWAL